MTNKHTKVTRYQNASLLTSPDTSLRVKAFLLFDFGLNPSWVATELDIKKATADRYFADYKKLPPMMVIKYRLVRRFYRKLDYGHRCTLADFLAIELDTTRDEVLSQPRRPWALRRLVSGSWCQWPVAKVEMSVANVVHRVQVRLRVLKAPVELLYIIEMAMDQGTVSTMSLL